MIKKFGNGLTINKMESIDTILKNKEMGSYDVITQLFRTIVFEISPIEQTQQTYIEELKKKGYMEVSVYPDGGISFKKEKFGPTEPAYCIVSNRSIKHEIYP